MRLNCPKCGKQVPDGATFCGACGALMNQATQPPAQQHPPPAPPAYAAPPPGYAPPQPTAPAKSGTSCWLIGCIALLVLMLILAVVGYFGWRRYQARAAEVVQAISNQLDQDIGGQQNSTGTDEPPVINEDGSNSTDSHSSESNASGASSGGSASGGSAATIPSPMPTLNAFLEDAGKGDGQAMARRMTPQAKAAFGEVADMWGQGDWEHDSFQVGSQQKLSETHWRFEVTETMRDWETNAPFYSDYTVSLQWNGSAWRVNEFDM